MADAGVPGVVAMRYNVYVVTAAQYTADLYAHLLAGRPLGQAATAARRALADDPARQITTMPVGLQDWAVPVIYEAAPLTLLDPEQRHAPLIKLSASEGQSADAGGGVPGPPDAGFFGRDETLLALDRAQALREHLASTAQVQAFVDRLRAGEAELAPGEDAALGRTRSLAASLSYGFTHAFTDAERAQLAVLHLFRDTIDADAFRLMGDPGTAAGDAVPSWPG